MNVHFDKKSGAIITHLRDLADPRRQRVRDYLSAIKSELPPQIKWLTDFRGIPIAEIDFVTITSAFEYRRMLCDSAPSIHCFLHSRSSDMLVVGVMNQIASIAEAIIPNARAVLTTNIDEALAIVSIEYPDQETVNVLTWPENEIIE